MSIATRVYAYMLHQTELKRGSWGEWYFRERYNKVLENMMDVGLHFYSVLEVGCGKGLYARILASVKADCDYIGCDVDRNTLKAAFRTGNSSYILCDAHLLPIIKNTVDLVLCSEVLEHLDTPYEILSNLADIPRCGVLVTFPIEHLGRRVNARHPEHMLAIELDAIVERLNRKNLKTLEVKEVGRFFFPCGILEFLRIPKNKLTMLLVESANGLLKKLSPLTFVPYQVILVVAIRKECEDLKA
jgi:2-polyprenyl-3-methyl-5-hydroxy-6-metoxy-1,4-benzoquinol methylase